MVDLPVVHLSFWAVSYSLELAQVGTPTALLQLGIIGLNRQPKLGRANGVLVAIVHERVVGQATELGQGVVHLGGVAWCELLARRNTTHPRRSGHTLRGRECHLSLVSAQAHGGDW